MILLWGTEWLTLDNQLCQLCSIGNPNCCVISGFGNTVEQSCQSFTLNKHKMYDIPVTSDRDMENELPPTKKKKIYQRLQIQVQLRITAKSYSYNLLLIVTLKTWCSTQNMSSEWISNHCIATESFLSRNSGQINTWIDYVTFLSACANPQMSYRAITGDIIQRQTVAAVTSMHPHTGTALYKPNKWEMVEDESTMTQILFSPVKNQMGLTKWWMMTGTTQVRLFSQSSKCKRGNCNPGLAK